jgi:hypothetical protein
MTSSKTPSLLASNGIKKNHGLVSSYTARRKEHLSPRRRARRVKSRKTSSLLENGIPQLDVCGIVVVMSPVALHILKSCFENKHIAVSGIYRNRITRYAGEPVLFLRRINKRGAVVSAGCLPGLYVVFAFN